MTKLFEIALGIATSIGGFLEAGSLSTAVQAGAKFRFQLIWAIVLGTVCLSFLVEMSGRFAAVSKHTIADAIRERFGFSFFLIPLLATLAVNLMVLSAEIGGVSYALQLVTNISFQVWAGPVAIALWLFLFLGTFALIEKGFSLLGLITLCFVVATVLLHPPWSEVARGIVPSLPEDNQSQYWFIAVAILRTCSCFTHLERLRISGTKVILPPTELRPGLASVSVASLPSPPWSLPRWSFMTVASWRSRALTRSGSY
jgi:hypothetical protein